MWYNQHMSKFVDRMKSSKYASRVTSSARGEVFNPLLWPFLFTTLIYGLGFTSLAWIDSIHHSSLFIAMTSIHILIPFIWGIMAVGTIIVGITFLLFNVPPAGKASGLSGFMVWVFAGFCWGLTGGWFLALALAVPNMWFWIWQYLSLSHFGRQNEADDETMLRYDAGAYDDVDAPRAARIACRKNRGVNVADRYPDKK
jgi:hypothetical protein